MTEGAAILWLARLSAVRLCDCFFLGTAISAPQATRVRTYTSSVELQFAQLLPARIGLALVCVLWAGLVQIRGADRA